MAVSRRPWRQTAHFAAAPLLRHAVLEHLRTLPPSAKSTPELASGPAGAGAATGIAAGTCAAGAGAAGAAAAGAGAAAAAAAAALSAAYCPGTMGGGRRFRNRGGKHRAYYKEKAKQGNIRPSPGKIHPDYAASAAWHQDRAAKRGWLDEADACFPSRYTALRVIPLVLVK